MYFNKLLKAVWNVLRSTAENKMLFPTNSRVRKTIVQFFSIKTFALKYVKSYQFKTYRKNRRVSSIVSRIVHNPEAILVFYLWIKLAFLLDYFHIQSY